MGLEVSVGSFVHLCPAKAKIKPPQEKEIEIAIGKALFSKHTLFNISSSST